MAGLLCNYCFLNKFSESLFPPWLIFSSFSREFGLNINPIYYKSRMKLHWMCNGYIVHTLKAWKFERLDLNPQTYILFSWNSIENIIFKYSLDASSPTRCCWGCARRTLKHRWKESFNQSCDFTYENLGVRLVVTYLLKTLFKKTVFTNRFNHTKLQFLYLTAQIC